MSSYREFVALKGWWLLFSSSSSMHTVPSTSMKASQSEVSTSLFFLIRTLIPNFCVLKLTDYCRRKGIRIVRDKSGELLTLRRQNLPDSWSVMHMYSQQQWHHAQALMHSPTTQNPSIDRGMWVRIHNPTDGYWEEETQCYSRMRLLVGYWGSSVWDNMDGHLGIVIRLYVSY